MTAPIHISLRALVSAALDPSKDMVYSVDTHTGDILKISLHGSVAELQRLQTLTVRDPHRFLRVPKPTGEDTYSDMMAFCATTKDKKLQERLQRIIRGGGTLRDFIDTLTPYDVEKERWYKAREARIAQRMQNWARENGLTV